MGDCLASRLAQQLRVSPDQLPEPCPIRRSPPLRSVLTRHNKGFKLSTRFIDSAMEKDEPEALASHSVPLSLPL